MRPTSSEFASGVKSDGVTAPSFTVNSNWRVTTTVPSGAKTGKISITTTGAPTYTHSLRPVDPGIAGEPIQQCEMDQVPMPASCQSRKRLQQVMPEPKPNSWGNISQRTPLRRTNTMPLRQARSGIRGRPPFGFRLGDGKRGSIRSHSSSGSSVETIIDTFKGAAKAREGWLRQ